MRVAIVGDYPTNAGQVRGGVQAAFTYLVKGLSRIEGLQTHVLTFRPSRWSGPERVEQGSVTLHLLPLFPRFERARNYRTYQATLNEALAQIRPVLVHAQDTNANAYVTIRSGYPAVVTAHGIRREDGKYYGSLGRRMRNYFDSLIERYIIRNTRHLVAISRYLTGYFAPLLRTDAQIHYIPNAIDERFFDLPPYPPAHTILFAGRVIPIKRILGLTRAFARIAPQIPAAQLRIAGELRTESAYVESVCAFIQQAGLGGRIHLLGQLSETEILDEFARCDLLALSSAQENLPMVIAQAMAASKPVVATRVGGVAEMVRDGETGLLCAAGDVDGLADALLRLLRDPSLRKRMGRTGHRFALDNYHADVVARRTCRAYQSIAGAK